MITRTDATLREEAARFGLKFRCDDCVHFIAERERCAHGYPTEDHRRTLDAPFVVFCKELEIA